MWVVLQVGAAEAGLRLDQVLPTLLEGSGFPLSRSRARVLIGAGHVFVGDRRVRVASRQPPARSLVVVDLTAERAARGLQAPADPAILFEDRDVIAIDKPCGWHSQAAIGRAEASALLEVQRWLHQRAGSPDQLPYVRLHHRLDRDTSGALILACSPRANRGLAATFRDRTATKTYRAVVVGSPPADTWTSTRPIGRLGGRGWGVVAPPRGKTAETRFTTIRRGSGTALVEASPRTGRTHQIRIHLATDGLPVLGDRLYGSTMGSLPTPGSAPSRLFLHAAELTLPHPVSGRELTIGSPCPEIFDEAVTAT